MLPRAFLFLLVKLRVLIKHFDCVTGISISGGRILAYIFDAPKGSCLISDFLTKKGFLEMKPHVDPQHPRRCKGLFGSQPWASRRFFCSTPVSAAYLNRYLMIAGFERYFQFAGVFGMKI